MVKKLIKLNLKIILCTIPQKQRNNPVGDIIKEIIESVSLEFNTGLLEFAHVLNLNYNCHDGIHPNWKGLRKLTEVIESFFYEFSIRMDTSMHIKCCRPNKHFLLLNLLILK